MNFKKSLKDVVVLVVICAVFATVLAAVNSVTAPIIAERLEGAANQAYEAVMPGATGFEDVDLSSYTLPATVVEAKREKSGMGYALKIETKGYSTGMVLIVGVSSDGFVTGATCIASGETWGLEKTFGDKTVGKDVNTIVDVEAGATSLTVNGYRAGVKDALNAAIILGGGSADLRTPEEILRDNLMAALPEGGDKFTELFMVEVTEGVDKIYAADNGKGYVCVIGEEFIGVGENGVALGESANKAVAEAAAAIVKASVVTEIDISEYLNSSDRNIKKIFRSINSVSKTDSGNYVVVAKVTGYADNMIVKIAISAEGVVIDATCLSSNETNGAEKTYGDKFIGKTDEEADAVDTIGGSTMTTDAYKKAVGYAFDAITIIETPAEGGAENE